VLFSKGRAKSLKLRQLPPSSGSSTGQLQIMVQSRRSAKWQLASLKVLTRPETSVLSCS